MKNLAVTISTLEESTINEDAVIAKDNLIAVSDGAGGGGVYAERWSSYLVNYLPEVPIKSFDELDNYFNDMAYSDISNSDEGDFDYFCDEDDCVVSFGRGEIREAAEEFEDDQEFDDISVEDMAIEFSEEEIDDIADQIIRLNF